MACMHMTPAVQLWLQRTPRHMDTSQVGVVNFCNVSHATAKRLETCAATNKEGRGGARLHALPRALRGHPKIVAALQGQDEPALGQAGHALCEMPKQLRAEVHASQRVAHHGVKARAHDDQVWGVRRYDRLQHLRQAAKLLASSH